MKLNLSATLAFILSSTLISKIATADTIHIDNPVFPTTSLPFAVNVAEVTQYGGSGDYDDVASQVCEALGQGLAVGPFDQDFDDITGTAIRVSSNYGESIGLDEVMSPNGYSNTGYKVLTQIDCQTTATPMNLQPLGYFSAKDVQTIMGSTLPVRFEYYALDPFCVAQGFQRAGTYSTDGTADEGVSTQVNLYDTDENGKYYVERQEAGFAQGVVCTSDIPSSH